MRVWGGPRDGRGEFYIWLFIATAMKFATMATLLFSEVLLLPPAFQLLAGRVIRSIF